MKLSNLRPALLLAALAIAGVAHAGVLNVASGSRQFSASSSSSSSSSGGGAQWSGFSPSLYAAPSDVGSGNCTSEANACDLVQACTALNSAAAGTTLGVIEGTYTLTNAASNTPGCAITTGGSSGNPKRIVAKYPALYNHATSALLTELRLSSQDFTDFNNTPVIGVVNTNHVEIYGIYVDWTFAPTRPSHGVIKFEGCTGCRVSEIVADAIDTGAYACSDNMNTVWSSNTDSLTISNNLFRGGAGSGNHNCAAIGTYGSLSLTIEYNTCDGVNSCAFIKGSGSSNTRGNSGVFRFNKSTDSSYDMISVAVIEASAETPGNTFTIQQNLAVDSGEACIKLRGDGEGAKNVSVIANTCAMTSGNGGGIFEQAGAGSGFLVRDNVVGFLASNSDNVINFESCGTTCYTTVNYNLYFESGSTPSYAQLSTGYSGIAAWRTATSKEANSTEGNPNFVNAAGGDFKRTGSGDTGSSTGGIRGAYITGSEQIGAPGT